MKKIILFILCICLAFAMVSCDEPEVIEQQPENTPDERPITLQASASSINVGEEVSVIVKFININDVKSFALKAIYSEDSFEIVNARMVVNALVSGFDKDTGIGTALYENKNSFEREVVMEVLFRAKAAGENKSIGFEASLLGEGDARIDVKQPASVYIDVK